MSGDGIFDDCCPTCGYPHIDAPVPLTNTQLRILRFIVEHRDSVGVTPQYRLIANEFGYRSLATVHEHVKNLERKGWLSTRWQERQSIRVLHELPA